MYPTEVITSLEHSSNGQPVWIAAEQALFWVEQTHKILYKFDVQLNRVIQHDLSEPILNLGPSKEHGFIATLADGIGFYDLKARKVIYISKPEPFDENTIVGGVADRRGHYWSLTQSKLDENQVGKLYEIGADRQTKRFLGEPLHCSTPPVFSTDDLTLYQSDGASRYIYATTLDESRQPMDTRVFCRISKAEGYPHGLCVDSEDNVWVCHRGAGILSCFNRSGERINKLEFDAPGLDYCTFGNKALTTLFILTSQVSQASTNKDDYALASSLISIEPGCQGLDAAVFLG